MPDEPKPTAVDLIATERLRQIEDEHWSSAHDDRHEHGQLAHAACVYAAPQVLYVKAEGTLETVVFMDIWPHDWKFKSDIKRWTGKGLDWHPLQDIEDTAEGRAHRIRDLTKAGALIAAEIDRLLRRGS